MSDKWIAVILVTLIIFFGVVCYAEITHKPLYPCTPNMIVVYDNRAEIICSELERKDDPTSKK